MTCISMSRAQQRVIRVQFQKLQLWKGAARRLRQMGGTLPGVTTLMTAFNKILSAFNLNNSGGNWFFQTERNKIPMVDLSPEQAATFFHTVEVNLNQTTTIVGWFAEHRKGPCHRLKAQGKAKGKDSVLAGKGEDYIGAEHTCPI